MHELYKILFDAAILTIVVAFIIGLIKFKYLTNNLKRALLLITIALTTEVGGEILKHFMKETNWFLKFTGPVEYAATAWFFMYLITSPVVKKMVLFSIPLGITLAVLNNWVLNQTNVNFTIVKGVLVSVCSLLYVQNLLQYRNKSYGLNYPEFVICMGLMFYYSFSVVFWSVYRYLVINKDPQLAIFFKIFPLLAVANIVMYIAYSIGFAIHKRPAIENA